MREWTRARGTRHCGGCGAEIRVGDAMIEYTFKRANGRSLTLRRCAECEGGAPPDLPTIIEFDRTPKPAIDFTRIGLLPLDYKQRAAEREPGEEG